MTDFEEQRMIEQARAGDPKAKFEMSQWARQMSALEPEEERWNRLAAKCLVESAQAGYEPARKMVQELITGKNDGQEPEEVPAAEEAAEEEPAFAPVPEEETAMEKDYWDTVRPENGGAAAGRAFFDFDAEEAAGQPPAAEEPEEEEDGPAQKILNGLKKAAAVAVAAVGGLIAKIKDRPKREKRPAPEPEAAEEETAARGRHSSGSPLVRWINDNWSVLRIVCIAVIVVMAALMVLLMTTPVQEPVPVPTPTMEPTPEPTPSPTPEPFPNEATRTEISTTLDLSYRPTEDEFLPASQSFTVDSDDGMNMRSGPSTEYDVLTRLADELRITAYASHRSGDETWYLVNTGGEWGWVIKDYLK